MPTERPRGPYRAPAWLPGGHLQTIFASRLVRAPRVEYRRELWSAPDGDRVAADWSGPRDAAAMLVLFHGLEGDSHSPYARHLVHAARSRGLSCCAVNFRGCGGLPNLLARAYHSGDSDEIEWMLARVRATCAGSRIYAVGISLGGNALLRWLGTAGARSRQVLSAAAAVCAPLDVRACGDALGHGFNRVYSWYFLRTLKPKALDKLRRHPGLIDRTALERSRNLREFDACYTAPVHGFRDTDDYWTQASSLPYLRAIEVPTLILNSRNDPFVPENTLPGHADVSAEVTLDQPEEGGHVGFVSGAFPGQAAWMPTRVLDFFQEQRRDV